MQSTASPRPNTSNLWATTLRFGMKSIVNTLSRQSARAEDGGQREVCVQCLQWCQMHGQRGAVSRPRSEVICALNGLRYKFSPTFQG